MSAALLHLPDALVHLGDPGFAAALQGFAAGQWERLFGLLNRIERRELRRTRLLVHRRLGMALAQARRLEGLGWTLAEAVARALDKREGCRALGRACVETQIGFRPDFDSSK